MINPCLQRLPFRDTLQLISHQPSSSPQGKNPARLFSSYRMLREEGMPSACCKPVRYPSGKSPNDWNTGPRPTLQASSTAGPVAPPVGSGSIKSGQRSQEYSVEAYDSGSPSRTVAANSSGWNPVPSAECTGEVCRIGITQSVCNIRHRIPAITQLIKREPLAIAVY